MGRDRERVETVLHALKTMAGYLGNFKVVSKNSVTEGKGLGFSASGFASSASLDLDVDYASLCETVRLGAGSATRSLAGRFAMWYADKNGRSYAEQLKAQKAWIWLWLSCLSIPQSKLTRLTLRYSVRRCLRPG